ncbi:hypothetical protein MMC22_000830 [Lobaria immixta]|nr:hypothetical protein [Lobaria immixta]
MTKQLKYSKNRNLPVNSPKLPQTAATLISCLIATTYLAYLRTEVCPDLGSSALFEKFNSSRNIIMPRGGGEVTSFQSSDTPTAQEGLSSKLPPAKDSGAATNAFSLIKPPAQKAQTLQGLGLDFSADAPSKAYSNSMRQKSRSKDSEEVESTMGSRMSALNNTVLLLRFSSVFALFLLCYF